MWYWGWQRQRLLDGYWMGLRVVGLGNNVNNARGGVGEEGEMERGNNSDGRYPIIATQCLIVLENCATVSSMSGRASTEARHQRSAWLGKCRW